ncbi:hypothetical protein [uncultured Flavobacterium sp.]|jgi:uncharacterized membrane protein|uniref:hypothetical protein n=1 Tax=uncultured Flavobacterium sp. TaxID=165435 RepID=UPI00259857EB|nr:hypothetical protein [uncultured Flavobacterium sp.]
MSEIEQGKSEIEQGKITAITSYILIIGVLIALSMNTETKNKFASFHIKQAIGLNITFISIGLLISNFSNTQIYVSFWVFFTVLWVFGIFSAIKGETKPIPLVGNLYQKFFKSF